METIFNAETNKFDVIVNGQVVASSPNKQYAITKAKTFIATSESPRPQQSPSFKFIQAEPMKTDDELREEINARFDAMHRLVKITAEGGNRAMIVSGAPGLGKTHGVDMELSKVEGIKVVRISGYTRPTGVFKTLYKHRHANCVVVLDDIDVFGDENVLNILKAACDMRETRTISWLTNRPMEDEDGEELPSSFDFHGAIIFLTNKDFDREIAAGGKLAPHLDAMISRTMYVNMKVRSTRDYMICLERAVENGALSSRGVSPELQDEIISFVQENVDKMHDLSVRALLKLANLAKADTQWKATARVIMFK
jgi:hypothetical protein